MCLVFSIGYKEHPDDRFSMCAYFFLAVNHSQNQYHFLIFNSSPLHMQYSSVDQELIFSVITVESNFFSN